MKVWIRQALSPGVVALALLLGGCQNMPYYDETLDWFSWSRYDSEVDRIEAEIPPPGALQARPEAKGDQASRVRDGQGGYVLAEPPPGVTVSLGATPFLSRAADGTISVADGSSAGASLGPSAGRDLGDPLVGIRTSYDASVTWRSSRRVP